MLHIIMTDYLVLYIAHACLIPLYMFAHIALRRVLG